MEFWTDVMQAMAYNSDQGVMISPTELSNLHTQANILGVASDPYVQGFFAYTDAMVNGTTPSTTTPTTSAATITPNQGAFWGAVTAAMMPNSDAGTFVSPTELAALHAEAVKDHMEKDPSAEAFFAYQDALAGTSSK